MRSAVATFLIVILSAISISSCVQNVPYRTSISAKRIPDADSLPQKSHLLDEFSPNVFIGYVEYNEYGNLFDRTQMYDVVRQVESLTNPIIVVFTHGWHHSAGQNDTNVEKFKETLSSVKIFENKTYMQGGVHRPVVGVYVGWRGESVDSDKALPLSILTFFDRKNTAHDVGNGGVEELFVRLNNFRYKPGNENSRLMIIGHSFGGLITYTALHHHFIEMVTANNPEDYKKPLGDVVIIVNPAIEAMRFKSLFEIAWSNEKYVKSSRPMLAIVTTNQDEATKTAFKWGRKISTIFNTYATNEDRELNTTAIGHYKPLITHTLLPLEDKKDVECHRVASLYTQVSPKDDKSICFINQGDNVPGNPLPTVLTRCDKVNDCTDVDPEFVRPKGSVYKNLIPYHVPILNIQTTSRVMDSHNDIWNPTMQLFLIRFMIGSLNEGIPAEG